jgi:galactose mutarotase-like enzyme
MPYAFGLHPGFRFDPGVPARVIFDAQERADVPVIAPGGLFSKERRAIAFDGVRLEIGPETFGNEALCFVPAQSRGLVFESGKDRRLRVDFPGFDNLVLWSRPHASFLCIEPWTGFGDPVGFTGDLYEKPGMKLLAPGTSAEHLAVFAAVA